VNSRPKPTGPAYAPEERQRAIMGLQASAARSKDGTPNLTRVSQEVGVSRQTLKRWWEDLSPEDRDHDPEDQAAATRPAASLAELQAVPEANILWAQERLGLDDPADHRVRIVADLLTERNATGAAGPRANLTKDLARYVVELRPTAASNGVPTPDEWVALVRERVELCIEAVLGSEEILTDPRLVDAVLSRARG